MRAEWYEQPWVLLPSRAQRFYTGGRLLEEFLGYARPQDGNRPEAWVDSTVASSLPRAPGDTQSTATESPAEGLAQVRLPDGTVTTLLEAIQRHPALAVGEQAAGATRTPTRPYPLLVKLLDSCMQLGIQCHPSDELARRYFASPAGKTESWLIMNTRHIAGQEEPYILLGLKPGVDRKRFASAVAEGDPKATAAMLHKLPVRPGDMFIVQAGVPHAIGPGIFMVEVQQPTDITVLADKVVGERRLADEQCHRGVGWERALDCFDFTGVDAETARSRWQLHPRLCRGDAYNGEWVLVGAGATSKFAATGLQVTSAFTCWGGEAHTVIVVEGSGVVAGATGSTSLTWVIPLRRGQCLFFPHGVPEHVYEAAGGPLKVLRCFPGSREPIGHDAMPAQPNSTF